jgi:cysteine-rich repeat protein
VHRYLPNNGSQTCAYTCKPYMYVDAPALTCTTPCNYLIADAQGGRLLAPRVRDYTGLVSLPSPSNPRVSVMAVRPRPRYIQGVCGTTETAPNSNLPFLRRGTYAYLSPTPVAAPLACGNALLDVGEYCDDGNTVGGDGCSAACTVETNQYYWDCDLIGAPCLPNCGWQVDATMTWGLSLRGYVLPACQGQQCSCVGLTYYDVQRLPVGARAAWMLQNLVPCNCGGNAQRTLPYANCTAANRGCRQCGANQYHDDSLGRCVPCGSQCAPGYRSSGTTSCHSAVSTSSLWQSNVSYAQAAVGCAPCPSLQFQVRYLRGCVFACYRATLVAGAQQVHC